MKTDKPIAGVDDAALSRKRLDLAELRRDLNGRQGRDLWRSLDELAGSPEFERLVHREFPEAASEWADGVSRRRFLHLMGASLAFGGLAACTRQPPESIVPFVEPPERVVPGVPLYFASGFPLDGFSTGVLVESHMGRPTKIEGNPEHPASLGATDVFAQASILDLYDPDRLQTVLELGRIRTWEAFAGEIAGALEALDSLGGARLRLLTGTVTSPTLAAQIGRLLERFPRARWHQWQPVGRNNARLGAASAFGRPAGVHYDLAAARVVVSLGADFLTQGAGAVRYARDFAAGRRVRDAGEDDRPAMNRLYCLESSPSATGTLADHRVPASNAEIARFAAALAAELGVPGADADAPTEPRLAEIAGVAARDLERHRGQSLVVPGEAMPAAVHVLCHAINGHLGCLGSTSIVTEPAEAEPVDETASIAELCADMKAGEVDVLLVLGGNPVYDAPADLEFKDAMLAVERRVFLGQSLNETAEYCQWSLPEAHYLESWADGRAYDGTATLCQPLIEPLYGGKTASEVLGLVLGEERGAKEILEGHWRSALGTEGFDVRWRQALHDGVVAGQGVPRLDAALDGREVARAAAEVGTLPSGEIELALTPDPTVWDGRFANNGWLQECPKPLTKLTWDNAALISPSLAEARGLANGDVVGLEVGGRRLEGVPVWIHPGQAPATVTLSLGYGRTRVGRIGTGAGSNAFHLRTGAAPWTAAGLEIEPTGTRAPLASTQLHSNIELEGPTAEDRHLIRVGTLADYEKDPAFAHHVGHGLDESLSLYPGWKYDGNAWALSVDLSTCTGCNACVVACQAENNIPIVGKEQVAMGREMHWIRIDRYYEGDLEDPAMHHQPVMCMHCEQAPCEVVCPVSATVHSDEGLNDMIYNRCVGTRYCSNNCPYKVRRFNFLLWNDWETPVTELLRNPDVTVRSRGVMEKCSYCVQRISKARIEAGREDREIRDGEIVTACQQACPTEAIVFGDMNDPESRVARRKKQPLDYGILTELGTRPRTTYLAKLRNPEEHLAEQGDGDAHG